MVALSKSISIGVGVIIFCLIMAAIGRGMGDTYAIFLSVSYTHLRAHETGAYLVCRLLLEKKK